MSYVDLTLSKTFLRFSVFEPQPPTFKHLNFNADTLLLLFTPVY